MKHTKLMLIAFALLGCTTLQSCNDGGGEDEKKWTLIFEEEFDGSTINTEYWSAVTRGTSHWNRYMVVSDELSYLENSNLVLVGRKRTPTPDDASEYETGGMRSYLKFGFTYGRIDIRCKLDEAQGNWPALWMMPNDATTKWPDGGEIDIMEHLNFDPFVYQTLHTNYTYNLKKTVPTSTYRAVIKRGEYNVYSLEWNKDELIWYVNDVKTFTYPRVETEEAAKDGQWPFDNEFYIILSQQLGGTGTWVGEIDDTQLPVKMYVDYVKVYQLK